MKTLLLIDGHYHLFRFFNGIPPSARLADGTQVNAIYGFIAMLRRLLDNLQDCQILVVFDSEEGTAEKKDQNSQYKDARGPADPGLWSQLKILKTLLTDACIPWQEVPGYEGDDVIASMARAFYDQYERIYIVSNDRDFYQLIDKKIHILKEVNGKRTIIDPEKLRTELAIAADQYLLYLALVGDKSDNIGGIPGIGPGWAAKIIGDCRTMEAVLLQTENIPKRFRKILQGNRESIKRTMEFLKMKDHVPLVENLQKRVETPIDRIGLQNTNQLLKRNGFG